MIIPGASTLGSSVMNHGTLRKIAMSDLKVAFKNLCRIFLGPLQPLIVP
jgi:hypothetical protein